MTRRFVFVVLFAWVVLAAPAALFAQEHSMQHDMHAAPVDPEQARLVARVADLLEMQRATGSIAATVRPPSPNATVTTGVAHTFTVVAHQFAFNVSPTPFAVNQGDDVTIQIRSADVQHGFEMENYIPTANAIPVGASTTKTFHFVANTAGDFTYFCTQPTCGSGHSNMFGTFTVNAAAPAPTIGGISPSSGPTAGGTAVAINGANFVSGATVTFGSLPATSTTFNNSTSITAVTPPQSAGLVSVTVQNPDGSSVAFSGFTYVVPAPTIASISPTSGPSAGGTAVTITGSGFQSGATVQFGGVAGTAVTVNSPGSITATTPAHATGNLPSLAVDVVVSNPDSQTATLASAFTYQAPPSVAMTSINPTAGTSLGGTMVTIIGSGFTGGGITVTIGGVATTNVTVVSDTLLSVTTGPHAIGAVDVALSRGSSSATLSGAYTYRSPGTGPPKHRSAKH
jgi:hypothetical protein